MNEEENINQSADNDKSSTEENKTVEEPATENNQLQTAEMEVHHPHHVTHKKKLAEYFLEFFMLFLAVFLGFVAENVRESNVDHEREKQFMVSMINELEADISQMKTVLQDTVRVKGIDLLLNIIYNGNIKSINTRVIYYLKK